MSREPRNLYTVGGGAVVHATPYCRHLVRSRALQLHTHAEATALGLRYCYDCEPTMPEATPRATTPPLPASQPTDGPQAHPDPERPVGDVVAAVVAALRYAAALAFHTDEELAQTLYDCARDTDQVGADADCCPVCEEVACDDDCPLAPYRQP